MRIVLIDCNYRSDNPHPVFAAMQRKLRAAAVELTVDNAWSDDYANFDLIIGADPIADRPALSNARVLGQRTLNRYQRMEIAAAAGAPVASFGSPANDDELSKLSRHWGDICVLKYDWSARRNGVFLWPLEARTRKAFPPDFQVGCDLFMEFLGDDPLTYKMDIFCGQVLGSWIFPTRNMRLANWQVVEDRNNYEFHPPEDLVDKICNVSNGLIDHGVGYASFDLMRTQAGFSIIEINSCSVGTAVWNSWPQRYAESYADAILGIGKRLDVVPKFSQLRQQAAKAGNDKSSVLLREKTSPAANTQSQPARPPEAMSAEMAFYTDFAKTDRLPAPLLTKYCRNILQDILTHAHRTVPFYKERLAPFFAWDGSFDWNKWDRVPLTRPSEIQADRQTLLSRAVPVMHGAMKHVSLVGPTGETFVVSKSTLQLAAESCVRARLYDWHKIDIAQPMATLLPGRHGQSSAEDRLSWAPEWLPGRHGKEFIGDYKAPASEQLRWLVELGPVYLRTTPSNARALADVVAGHWALRPSLSAVLTQGGVVSDEDRSLCQERLGHDLIDVYDPLEAGMIALQCPTSRLYHAQSEVCLVEILGSDGKPCGPGGSGEIVITPFYNYVMPLIRYATGDVGELPARILNANEACSCGRHLPSLQRIKTRRPMLN